MDQDVAASRIWNNLCGDFGGMGAAEPANNILPLASSKPIFPLITILQPLHSYAPDTVTINVGDASEVASYPAFPGYEAVPKANINHWGVSLQ